jgi:NAD(P)-dependent dehydrogenase (short-subunit alcohol dehydrogenase family)
MRELEGQTIILIGATSGMGQAVATRLAGMGTRLALTGRDAAKLSAVEQAARQAGATDLLTAAVEVADESQVADFFARVTERFGSPEAMVYMPGLSIPGQIAETDAADFQAMMDAGVKGAFFCAKHYARIVDEQAGGLVVNISSMAGKRANPAAPLYCTSKAAMNMLSDGLALQGVKRNIRVTTISPGAAATPFWGERSVPTDKFLTPEEIADVVEFVLRMPSRVVIHDVALESFEFLRHKA